MSSTSTSERTAGSTSLAQGLTAREAAERLLQSPDDYATPDALQALAAQVSIAPMGGLLTDRTVFYSGSIQNENPKLDAWTLATSIQKQDAGVLIIDTTERGVFLASKQFKKAVLRAFASEGFVDFSDVAKRRDSHANQFLFDATQGVWAQASRSFAESASGHITTLTSQAPDNRTFALVELPTLLANPKVHSVNGVSKQVLQELANGPDSLKGVLKAVAETSRQKLLESAVVRSAEGMIVGVDTTTLLNVPPRRGKPAPQLGTPQAIQAGQVNDSVLDGLKQAERTVKRRWLKRHLAI